ncbi:MAG: hypothetical protein U1A72_24165 [Sulfuritalea sp.]|nr:hypothetical protein [Sulfuritalea sp.]
MNSPVQPYSYKSPALYNPRLWHANEVRAYYVARPALLDRIVDDLKREDANTHPQHRLIVGLRGMGKSTLLRRIAVAVEDNAQLNASWLPLSFPEEQYNVASLGDFWLNCLDALSDLLESRGQIAESLRLDAEVEQLDRKDGEGALGALLRTAGTLQRRLLLLVDNVDLVFDRIKNEDWKLREALQAHPEILIVGASAKVLEDTYNYKAAFYDFFKIDELRGLSEAEMRETIVNLARLNKAEHIVERIDADPARLRVLHTLTGGNPRTAVLLYGVLLKGIDGDVRSDLEGLLDEVTPLYKSRFEELPPQSQQLLDKLALHWHPASAAVLTKQLGWKVNLVSAQLDRLIGAGIVERVKAPKSKRLNFQIGERFFNIWYLMRTSRRLRRRLIWLVECLRGLYSNEELQTMARLRMGKPTEDVRDAETMVALSDALDDPIFKRALTDCALELLIDHRGEGAIAELFDLDGAEHDIETRRQQIEIGRQFKQTVDTLPSDSPTREWMESAIFDSELVEKIIAAESTRAQNNFSDVIDALLKDSAKRAISKFGPKAARLLAKAIQSGLLKSLSDKEGAEALALRWSEPYLAALARSKQLISKKTNYADLEQNCRSMLAYDEEGFLVWFLLACVLALKREPGQAAQAAERALTTEGIPADIELDALAIVIADKNSDWSSLATSVFTRINLGGTDTAASLGRIASLAVQFGKAHLLLQTWDKAVPNGELLPFREALNAAAHNDVSLLDLLAPEVKEPAKQFLAVIAPKLLQHAVE